MLLELIAATSSVVGGFVAGRVYGAISGNDLELINARSAVSTSDGDKAGLPTAEKVAGVAEKLMEHAESMAASVDEHQVKMRACNDSLTDNDHATAEDVLAVVNNLIEANRTMQRQLNEAQTKIAVQSMELESSERRAHTDALTRISNRRAFDIFIAQQHQKGVSQVTTLAILDVDHFKKFNDNHGHLAGDEVLRVVAGMLHSRLNQYGMAARYGGEEFALIFTGTPAEEVKQLIEKTRIAISQRETEFENKVLRVTASIGVAQFDGNESIEQWVRRADAGLYRSKEQGRNCSHWMDEQDPILITAGDDTTFVAQDPGPDPVIESIPEIVADDDFDTPIDQEPIPEAFADISNQVALNEAYSGIRDRMQSDVPVFVMAIRNHQGDTEATMKSLLPVVRSTLRAVDRIGYADASTLLICMLSVEQSAAKERGMQICRSAQALDLASGNGCKKPVTVGIARAMGGETFDLVVSRAIDLAMQATQDDCDPVCIETSSVETA